jgi:hypothetical protein
MWFIKAMAYSIKAREKILRKNYPYKRVYMPGTRGSLL